MRKHRNSRVLVILCCLAIFSILAILRAEEKERALPAAARERVDFERDIAPLFAAQCQSCHGVEQQLSGLRLDRRADAMTGGYSGPVILPGDSAGSRLIQLVAGLEKDLVMPMVGERLTAGQVGLLRAWIDQGADWPEQAASAKEQEEARPTHDHWAFNAPVKSEFPKVSNPAWVRNPIDAFVLGRLEEEGIDSSPEAGGAALIRRLSLDLTGLPPTPAELADFLNDRRPDAYERLVDRLLASPHYGEKWARHWLDLAHYADSDGYEKDLPRPHAWRWRNWVIEALNGNMPFDQFTMEQVAGDLLPDATVEQRVATGFFRNTLTNREAGTSREEFRVEQVLNRTETLGTVWLGLTVGCARCHDHKYDPISQKDFYQLSAFFNSAQETNIDAPLGGEMGPYLQAKPVYDRRVRELLADHGVPELQVPWERGLLEAEEDPGANLELDNTLTEIKVNIDRAVELLRQNPSERREHRSHDLTRFFIRAYGQVVSKERYKELKFGELRGQWDELRAEFPALSQAQTMMRRPEARKSHVLNRGNYEQPGIEVQPHAPAVMPPLREGGEPARLRLARWLVSRENPLTARVTVNRIWQELFGQGLVKTSEDFGTRGDPPTHPRLLDWLAVEFMDGGWDIKKLQKLIVTSATYRQSSNTRRELQERDPNNQLLARQARLRLSAELVRDATLAASGLLSLRLGGKSVRPPLPAGVFELGYGGRRWEVTEGVDQYRRGLYLQFRRTTPYPQLVTFDAPDSLLACSRRERSTTPLQALNLLNDPVFVDAARALAVRVLREERGSLGEKIDYAYRLCLARSPRPSETDRLIEYFRQQQEALERESGLVKERFPLENMEGIDPAEAAAWVGVGRVLLNLEEFITRG